MLAQHLVPQHLVLQRPGLVQVPPQPSLLEVRHGGQIGVQQVPLERQTLPEPQELPEHTHPLPLAAQRGVVPLHDVPQQIAVPDEFAMQMPEVHSLLAAHAVPLLFLFWHMPPLQ